MLPNEIADTMVKINIQMQLLGWRIKDGRDYLKTVYGKRSRHVLTDKELSDFLKYLESQPTPLNLDLIAASYDEIKRLCWSAEEEQAYLLNTYATRSPRLLTKDELEEFLIYLRLQFQSIPIDSVKFLLNSEDNQYYLYDELDQAFLEIQRLGWTDEQRKDYLMKTYGKKSCDLLTPQELQQFITYLKSLLAPNF